MTPDIEPKPPATTGARKVSLTLLENPNLGTFFKDGKLINTRKCSYNEIYDIAYDKCREVICPPTTFPRKGRCVLQTIIENQMQQYSSRHNCTWTKLDPTDYIFTNDSNLFVLSAQETYNDSQLHQNGTDVFICLSTCFQCDSVHVVFNFDESKQYLSTIGHAISILSLLSTVIIYLAFPQLLNTPGKILLSMVVSLLLAQLFDITFFIFTAVHKARARKQEAVARRKKNTCSLLINIMLSLVMGLTWVFAFVANVAKSQFMWYLFVIFNTCQGLFIAIFFLCTRKVVHLVHEKYAVFSSTFRDRDNVCLAVHLQGHLNRSDIHMIKTTIC
ncbi:AGRG2-like protein [Mya arenaria]|uniref:AGRG2-like protein n=1 Tax=Mya arenaria TaxID=6604 RepID=A0ABY7EPI8_MYAAR|nr:AGRG2-like protein [Mya arenaria]